MYLDFDDLRPDTPRVPSALSVREGLLWSLVAHGLVLLFILFAPAQWFEAVAGGSPARAPRGTAPLRPDDADDRPQ